MRNAYTDLFLMFVTLTYVEAEDSRRSQGISSYQSYLNDDNEYGNLGSPDARNSPVQSSQSNLAISPRSTKGAGTSFAEYMKDDDGWQQSLGRDPGESSDQQNKFDIRNAPVVGSPKSQPDLALSAQRTRGVGPSFADYMKDDDDRTRNTNRAYGQLSAPRSSFDVRNAPTVGSQDNQSYFAPSPQGIRSSGTSYADYMRDEDGWQRNVHRALVEPSTTQSNSEARNAPVVGSQSSQSDFAYARQPSWPAHEQRSWSGSGNHWPRSESNWSNQQSPSYGDYPHSMEERGRAQRSKVENSPRCIPGNAAWPTICRSRNEDPVFYHGPFGVQRIATSGAAWDK